jgi:hypothetical protein
MLRVEASNLPSPRTPPRSRRLHASNPSTRRSGTLSRHEMLPPPEQAQPRAERLVAPVPPVAPSDRWSVRLELIDDDVAKLYGQGLARGALVWKKGMIEWRPLLITPELTSLLRRTRITLTDSSPPAEPSDPVTSPRLPAPARVPSEIAFTTNDSGRRVPVTVSPLAIDVEPTAPTAPIPWRRRFEVGGAALAGFALAWLAHSGLTPDAAAPMNLSLAAAAAPVAAPVAPAAPAPQPTAASSIPLVAISDLPLLRGAGSAVHGRGMARATSAPSNGDGPSRTELVGALSRVAGAASGCGERGGPVRLVMTFTNSGVARSIQVSGPDLPAATRSCIIGAASRARIGAFSGAAVTVSKTL